MTHPDSTAQGSFDARYLAFLETVTQLRPRLHRYCARMTGSVLDGEDVVQEALFSAYRKLDKLVEDRPLAPWLFRIAHNRCIDFLRHREVQEGAEAGAEAPKDTEPREPVGRLDRAVEHLVLTLPPKERACVVLKDVFDYSLEEIAGVVDSSVGGVKAALNRGRSKLALQQERPRALPVPSAETSRLLGLYVERFNLRDWSGLRELIAADAQLRVADRFSGSLGDSPYFGNYETFSVEWRMAVGEVDGAPVVLRFHRDSQGWQTAAVIDLEVTGGRITRIRDYTHCPWLLGAALSVAGTRPS